VLEFLLEQLVLSALLWGSWALGGFFCILSRTAAIALELPVFLLHNVTEALVFPSLLLSLSLSLSLFADLSLSRFALCAAMTCHR